MESVEMKDVENVDAEEKVIVEGSATIFEEGQVFYNPVQEVIYFAAQSLNNFLLSFYHFSSIGTSAFVF